MDSPDQPEGICSKRPVGGQRRTIVLTILLTAIVVSMGWLALGGGLYWVLTRNPPDFEVVAPDSVPLGESFSLVVRVSNPKNEPLDLRSIDFSEELLKGFEVLSIDPVPESRHRAFGYLSCYYRPAKSLTQFSMTIKLRAKEVGSWGGDIDGCTLLENFVSRYTEVKVVDSEGAGP